jgi:hypothetical protein
MSVTYVCQAVLRIRIRDPRSDIRWFFTPWIRDEFFPDLGSRIQGVCFWWDFLKNPCSLILLIFTNKTCTWNYKKQEKSWFYFSSLFLCTVGSGIKKLGIRIRDPGENIPEFRRIGYPAFLMADISLDTGVHWPAWFLIMKMISKQFFSRNFIYSVVLTN